MAHRTGPLVLAGLLAALAATPAAARSPDLACGPFALTAPLALPRETLVVRSVSLHADHVLLNGACVSKRARVRSADGSVRFAALFGECGLARGIKLRGVTDETCTSMHGRLFARRPPFRAHFVAGPASEPECGPDGTCVPGSFCELPPGVCAANLFAGACVPRPDACPAVVDPVCGCNGITYGSDCERQAAGVSKSHDGACETGRCGTIAGLPCPDGFVCDLEPGMCAVTDLGGVCVPVPGGCPDVYLPVCGCDGVTYGNDCERVAAGAQKDRDGPCECAPILCPPDTLPVDTNHDGCVDDCIPARCETNADCPPDRWCANDAGDCALPGYCYERPLGCPDVWRPVCGCDGQTYSNECDAAAAGVRVAHQGTCLCEPPICPDGQLARDADSDGCPDRCVPVAGCLTHADCPEPNTFCGFEPGGCGSAPGRCLYTLDGCPTLADPTAGPVCGCDGRSYRDACQAGSVGISVDRYGACGDVCGTIVGLSCPDGEICDIEPGSCHTADAAGSCVPRPEVCPELYAPVCGCDSVTYGNDCERLAAGVTKAHDGKCPEACPTPVAGRHASCETTCDCYAVLGTAFCPDCPLLCPNCGDYWQCREGRCVEECGPLPPDVVVCLDD